MRCTNCGLLYVKNRPDEYEITQAVRLGEHGGEKTLRVTGRYNRVRLRRYKKVLEDLFNGDLGDIRTLLDVGCGFGEFMETMRKHSSGSISVKGMEPNIEKIESAHRRNLNVSYFSIESHNEKYDLISMLDVYSHLPDPPRFIRSLRRLLNPGGEVLIQTGNTAHLSAKDHMKPFCLPDHLSFASEAIVTSILERLDFEIVKVRKCSCLSLSPKSVIKEIVKLFMPSYHSNLKYYFEWKIYAQTDMFIRARLKG